MEDIDYEKNSTTKKSFDRGFGSRGNLFNPVFFASSKDKEMPQ
jgi:hypothetical protein